jgi:hypothetical protein
LEPSLIVVSEFKEPKSTVRVEWFVWFRLWPDANSLAYFCFKKFVMKTIEDEDETEREREKKKKFL